MICEGECLHFAFDGYSIGNHFDFWLKGISMREKRSARDVNSWEEEMTMALSCPVSPCLFHGSKATNILTGVGAYSSNESRLQSVLSGKL